MIEFFLLLLKLLVKFIGSTQSICKKACVFQGVCFSILDFGWAGIHK